MEDIGICLGQALRQSVGDGKGLTRYGHAVVPMDEALAEVSVDFSGRPFLVFKADLPSGSPGGFDAELGEEFFRAVAMNARISLHMELRYGRNMHHCLEECSRLSAGHETIRGIGFTHERSTVHQGNA